MQPLSTLQQLIINKNTNTPTVYPSVEYTINEYYKSHGKPEVVEKHVSSQFNDKEDYRKCGWDNIRHQTMKATLILYIHCESKRELNVLSISLVYVERFSNYFTVELRIKFMTK